MRYSVASTAAFVVAAVAYPQVPTDVAPEANAPEGCTDSYDGEFKIQVMNVTDVMKFKRQNDPTAGADTLMIELEDGVLTDSSGATGYIAANNQFQFDSPPQTGAIYTAGWSACNNGSLALGGSTVFYQCLSGDFYNIYDESRGGQCNQVIIEIVGADASTNAPASQLPDGQPQATPATQAVSQIPDGQLQAPTDVVSQIPDGQIQAPTDVPVVSQIPDGQVQAPTATVGPVVSQIPDGQVQAPTDTVGPVVSQIPDGQVQAPTAVVSQIPDGQVQAPFPAANGTAGMMPSGTGAGAGATGVVPYEGAGNKVTAGGVAVAALFGLALAL